MNDNKSSTPTKANDSTKIGAEAKAVETTKTDVPKAAESKPSETKVPEKKAIATTSTDKKESANNKLTKDETAKVEEKKAELEKNVRDDKSAEARTKKEDVKDEKPKKLSALDAAAQVLAMTKQPMNCKELIGAMAVKGLWSSPNGQTPNATLYAAIQREINTKGKESRFEKVGPGRFALRKKK